MKKSIIASAIAATVISTSAYSMETASELAAMLESMPTVYGNVQLAWGHGDEEGVGGTDGLVDNGSTIGFKHSHQINDDLKAFVKIEFDGLAADDKATSKAGSTIRLDEAFFGVQGDFGRVIVGSEDSEFEKNVATINNHWEFYGSTRDLYTTGEGDLVQYASNSMDGFKVFAAVELDSSEAPRQNPFQLGLGYSVDALTVALAYDSNDGQGDDADGTIGLHASYAMDNFKVTGEIQTQNDVADSIALLGVYSAGANQYSLGLSQTDYEGDDKSSAIVVQALHNVSSNTYVYATAKFASDEVSNVDTDSKGVAIGATYYF